MVNVTSSMIACMATINTSSSQILVDRLNCFTQVLADIASPSSLESKVTIILPTALGEPVTNWRKALRSAKICKYLF